MPSPTIGCPQWVHFQSVEDCIALLIPVQDTDLNVATETIDDSEEVPESDVVVLAIQEIQNGRNAEFGLECQVFH